MSEFSNGHQTLHTCIQVAHPMVILDAADGHLKSGQSRILLDLRAATVHFFEKQPHLIGHGIIVGLFP